MSPRTLRLLEGPILPVLLGMAWPNILVMLAQASTGLIETWWISRLGTDALAGMALVFPGFMLMGMLSAGAMGGGISSAVARALGGGRQMMPMRCSCMRWSSTACSAFCSRPCS
jgi:Na+-driven multidrug efflux pump